MPLNQWELKLDEDLGMGEEPVYEIELDEDEGMPGHHDHDDRYDVKQGYNARLDDTLGAKDGAEHMA